MEKLRLLIVDDEPKMRMGVARALRNFTIAVPDIHDNVRFEIDSAETGEEALAYIGRTPPDIMLLDHKLPGIQGLEVLGKITEEGRDILTVMVTAYASIETAVSATKRGAYDFLAKPFTPQELKSTVEKAGRHAVLQRHARRLAQEKKQMRFQLISVVAHELKAPLAAIEGFLNLLKDPAMARDQDTYLHVLDRSMARLDGMRKLITDLLDLTRIESGQKQRDLVMCDICAIARSCIETASATAEPRGIDICMNAPESLSLVADPGEMQIIFNNLLSNAVKYNRDNGKVFARIGETDGQVIIEIRDTGIGMSEAETARLFEEFVRIKNAKTRNIPGSGLGLSILKKLAGLYGGTVAVHSVPDEGTTFTVTLNKSDLPRETGDEMPAESGA